MSTTALGCVNACGRPTGGPKPFGTAGAAGILSAGTVMPAGGFAEGGRTEPGRGGNAEPDDLLVTGAAAAAKSTG
jgi:hypothetical protein